MEAAVVSQIAASHASYSHHGAFASPDLERILREVGGAMFQSERHQDARNIGEPGATPRVLHVLTAARDVGGDTRFVWRWIQRDGARRHSLAVTSQGRFGVPNGLTDSVKRAGGRVHVLDQSSVDPLSRARQLRDLARDADFVFLHIYPEDVVPLIAFAVPDGMPPVVFLDQADHQFWLGASIGDYFVQLRRSARPLAVERRGLDARRLGLLPIPLLPIGPGPTRAEAKRQLGYDDDTVLLLTIARGLKYEPAGDPPFPTVLQEIIAEYPKAVVVAIGPDSSGPWESARAATGGRVLALGRRSDTDLYFRAGDIYLDSFPVSSNTSLLEAAGYGLPLVSYIPNREGEDATALEVLNAGAPGLDDTMLRAADLVAYRRTVSELIADPEWRRALGDRTKALVDDLHAGPGWDRLLAEMYQAIPPLGTPRDEWSGPLRERIGEYDLLLKHFYSTSRSLGSVIDENVGGLCYPARLRVLLGLIRLDRGFSFSMLLPNGLRRVLAGRLGNARQWFNRALAVRT
ncbi:MAG: hypothetical protein U1E83_07935 [Methylotetracoccus sp.]